MNKTQDPQRDLANILMASKIDAIAASTIGEFKGDNAKEYFQKIQIKKDIENWSDKDAVNLLRTKLGGDALRYYVHTKELHSTTITFKEFSKLLLTQFTKKRIQGQIFGEITNCRQNVNEKVEDFARRLQDIKLELVENEGVDPQLAERICLQQLKTGLRSEIIKYIRVPIGMQQNITFDEVIKIAESEEMELEKVQSLKIDAISKQEPKETRKCYLCGKPGHLKRDCRNSMSCSRCGRYGHVASNCRGINQYNKYSNYREQNRSRQNYNQYNNYGSYREQNRPGQNYSHNNNYRERSGAGQNYRRDYDDRREENVSKQLHLN